VHITRLSGSKDFHLQQHPTTTFARKWAGLQVRCGNDAPWDLRWNLYGRVVYRSHGAWKPAPNAGFPHSHSDSGDGTCLGRKANPAEIAGPVRFLHRTQKLEGAQPGSKLSTNQSDVSANSKSLSKGAPRSRPATLTKEGKQTTTSTNGSPVDVDASTRSVTTKTTRIFGTDDEHSRLALALQVVGVTTSNGKHGLQNVKGALGARLRIEF
jgi:hypothetical protein